MIDQKVKSNTLLTQDRLESLDKLSKEIIDIPGQFAQVGIYKGGSARILLSNTYKKCYLFDTFEGLPEPTESDLHHKGDFSDTTIEHVEKVLEPYHNYQLIKGRFPETTGYHTVHQKFSFVYIDVDLYQDTLNCLNYFYDKLNPGGILVSDDYEMPSCPGVKKAFDEFMVGKSEKLITDVRHQVRFVKL